MRVAIVHDWLVTWSGAEKVLGEMLSIFADAEIFTLVDTLSGRSDTPEPLQKRKIHTSFIQRLPHAHKYYRRYLPLMPLAVEQFDFKDFDLVISLSHAVAKGVVPDPTTLHICYCFTPMRYAWDMQTQYLNQVGKERGVVSALMRWQLHRLRQWDYLSAQRADRFIAISEYIAERIKKCYRREAEIVYPPVDVKRFCCLQEREEFYLTASRMVPYKRIDLIVEAFSQMPDRELVVIGEGPEKARIESRAQGNIRFLGYQDDKTLQSYLERTRAFIFMAEEDFGILPVEAQAAGAPVICYGKGGAAETIQDKKTGLHVQKQSAEALAAAVEKMDTYTFEPEACRANAARFDSDVFRERFKQQVQKAIEVDWKN